jgi:hypothetical protein
LGSDPTNVNLLLFYLRFEPDIEMKKRAKQWEVVTIHDAVADKDGIMGFRGAAGMTFSPLLLPLSWQIRESYMYHIPESALFLTRYQSSR